MLRITLISCLMLFALTPARAQSETTDTPKTPAEAADPQSSSGSGSSSGWQVSVAPYFFLASLDGTVGVVGQRAEVNASFRDLFRNLDFAIMGQVEARKGKWSILGDAMYMSLSGKRVTPSPLFGDIEVEVKE